MTSASQGEAPMPTEVTPPRDGNQVVISGMSGLYPKSRYVRDLENILYNKINPITSENLRWSYSHPEAAQYAGNVPGLDRFDAQFFKVHYRLGANMDPMSRKMLEQAYEAIYDAGVSPEHLSGKKVGVYVGSCFSETEKACFYDANSRSGLGIPGCNKSMFANRISYWLNARGPSHSIDDACCSSTVALEQAYLAIRRGECEAAIVGGANLNLHPHSSVHCGRIMTMSNDGKTKSFDQKAAGCAKSEAINVLFLQRAEDALRIYANVVNVQCEFIGIPSGETGPKYGFYRDPEDTARFLKRFYDRAGVPPNIVEYVEGFGSALPDADKSELEAFDKIFCSNRDEPLMVGSIMSNIGYGEAASGISAITKVLLGYHRGELAGNLNCETPRSDVAAINEGRIQVLNDHQRFRRTYAAVNSMSVTGVNSHVLFHGNYKPKDINRYKTNIPHLVLMSGRQESSVKRAFDELKSRPIDPEQLALMQNIHQTRIAGHLGRGYTILDTKDGKTVSLSEQVDYFNDVQRPLWFVYSGMGSQWSGMGTQLMRLPIFAAAIEQCRQVLTPKGIDIVHIITSPDKTIFDNILHSFVGIAAVQIGLTDVLRELGLVPDKIIGHSVGELGCAYADGCLTAEEIILSAYSRGLVSLETPFIKGSMAAVGLGFQEVAKLCPPEIEIACHNSAESCTISGPADAMQTFVGELVAKGIFAKEVPCSNIAYHSRCIAKAGPGLLKYLKEVIKTPKARSDKWVSTSVPQDRWEEEVAKFSSAEYHTNNLLSPVLFEETSRLIPSNAVLVEIAPHGLLQAILKRSLPQSCTNITLTRRGHPDSPRMVLEAVGKLYMEGYNPKVQVLYPKVEFPVSTGTPFLSNLVDWAHNEKWTLPLYVSARRVVAATCKFIVSVHDDEYSYLKGHVIQRKTQLPFSYALIAAWDTLAMTLKVPKKQLNVVFNDVHFYAQPLLHEQDKITLVVSLHRGTGLFEVMDNNFKVATGFINSVDKPSLKSDVQTTNGVLDVNSQDVYRMFYDREYAYSGQFRSIHSVNDTSTEANILWNDNWVTFIDGMLQLNALKHPYNAISEPSQIRIMAIDITEHLKFISSKDDVAVLKAHASDVNDYTRCGGVLIENLKFRDLPSSKEKQVNLKKLQFVPRYQSNIDTFTSLQIFIQIVSENTNKETVKIVGIAPQNKDIALFDEMKYVAAFNIPGIKIEYQTVIKNATTQSSENIFKEADLVLVQNLSNDDYVARMLQRSSRNDVFIINQDALTTHMDTKSAEAYKIVSVFTNKNTDTRLELVHFQSTLPAVSTTSVVVRSERDLPSLIAARSKLSCQNSLIILTTYPPFSGLKSLVKHWRKDSSQNNINLIMVNDAKDTKQLGKLPSDLAYNVLDNGIWGGEYYLSLIENLEKGSEVILKSEFIGNLESLKWIQAPSLPKAGVSVKVHYAGINMNDVLRATGVMPMKNEDIGFGMDFSGVTESGERIMGLLPVSAAQSYVIAQPELMWPIPSHWNLEDAATVPLAYVYAYYCLDMKYNTRLGNDISSVLVHGGTGALGQAMISVSLARGYRVFTTVSNLQKKKFLLKLFPQLKEKDIGNSRDALFGDMITSATDSNGCDIIVCSLKGELKNTSLKCSAKYGHTYDTAQIHNQEIYNFGMSHLTKERTYTTIDISSIFLQPKVGEVKRLQVLVSEGIASGTVRPLSRLTYAMQDVSRAFRLLAASQHRGRVLLRLQEQHQLAQPSRLTCSEDGSHIIFCDVQPIGLQLADLLISSGAKKIHLHFEQPPIYLRYKQRAWNKKEVQISASSEDLKDETGLTNFLHSAMTSGPVHGVYVAADYLLKHTMLTMLDVVVRKSCPSLKKFLMFNNGDDSGQFIAIKRAKDGLPATVLNLSMLETVEDEEGLTWYTGIKEATKQALLSSHPVVLSQLRHLPRESLVQQIAALTDVTISEEINCKTTLEDLHIPLERSQAISSFLRNVYNMSVDEADIPSLSVESLKQMEEKLSKPKFEDAKGLGIFFSYVDPDELLATTEMVFLPTLTNNSTMRDDEFDVNQTFMCIVPGLEGHHERFRALCECLKLPALVLQPGLDHLQETVEELALRYSEVLIKRAGVKNSFYLLGCETGVLVALELAAILEQLGQTGTVFCIGDGPEEIKSLIKEQLREFKNEEALQFGLVQHMFTLMTGESASLMENIEGVPWRQRVDTCVRTLLGHVSHSAQYARSLIEAAYARIATTICYNANPKVLKSNIVLIRALSSNSASTVPCSLQRYSHQPISVHNLTTPLAHVAKDVRCASIINKHLSKEILDAFDSKNVCESYLLNADTIMILTEK